MADEPSTKPSMRRGPEIPELTEAYRKARRNLVLCSAILIFWEYVGVTLGNADEKSVSLSGIKLGFKNAEAIPAVIFLVTLYLAFRCYLEWSQVSFERRAHRSAFLDISSTSLITVVALGLFMGQTISDVRIADVISERGVGYLATLSGLLTLLVIVGVMRLVNLKQLRIRQQTEVNELREDLNRGFDDPAKQAAMTDFLSDLEYRLVDTKRSTDRLVKFVWAWTLPAIFFAVIAAAWFFR